MSLIRSLFSFLLHSAYFPSSEFILSVIIQSAHAQVNHMVCVIFKRCYNFLKHDHNSLISIEGSTRF